MIKEIILLLIILTGIIVGWVFVLKKDFFTRFFAKFSIQKKIIFSFIILFIFISIVIATLVIWRNNQTITNEVIKHLQSVSSSRTAHVQTYLLQNIERLKLITSRTALRNSLVNYNLTKNETDLKTIDNIIKDAVASTEDYDRICILGLNGQVLTSTNQDYIGRDVKDKQYFIEGLKTNEAYIEEDNEQYKIFVSGPLIKDNQVLGVGLAVIKIDNLEKIVTDHVGLGKTGEMVVAYLDQNNEFIYPIKPRFFIESTVNSNPDKIPLPMKSALNGESVFFAKTYDYRGQEVMAVTSYVPEIKLGVVVKIDRFEALSSLYNLILIYVLLIFSFIILYYFISYYLAKTITGPLIKMTDIISRSQGKTLNYDLVIEGQDEVALLSKAFFELSQRANFSQNQIQEKVNKQTAELKNQQNSLEKQKTAILNILQDVEIEKNRVQEIGQKFETLVSNVPGVVYRCLYDPEWTMIYMSDHVEELTGYAGGDLLNNQRLTFKDLIYPADRLLVQKKIATAIKNKKPWEIEYRLIKKDKSVIWIKENGRAILDENNKVLFLDGLIIDVTDIKKKELVILEANQELSKYKLAVSNASDHIVITDPEGIILYANEAVTKITGFQVNEVLGKKAGSKDLWGGLMDSDFYKQMWETIKIKKQAFKGEISNQRKNGEKYIAFATISPVIDKNGKLLYFVGIERDITIEKAIDRAKSEFVSIASHQLRTPLSSINWYTEMLLDDSKNLKKEQKEFLGEIADGSKRMVRLVNDLLNVSRLELGRMIVEPQKIDMIESIKTVIKQYKILLINKKGKVIFNEHPEKLFLDLDPTLFNQVVGNVLSNAIKYSPPDRCHVTIKVLKKQKYYEISIADKGMGIPLADQSKIFSKMYRADNARKLEVEGSGLGLYIVKMILEAAGGNVEFKSIPDQGTTFYLRIPLKGMRKVKGDREFSA